MPAIFISYRTKDVGGHVGWLREKLKRRYGGRAVFTDFESLPPGSKWREEIEKALDDSDIALVVIGEHWMENRPGSTEEWRIDDEKDVLRGEVVSALQRDDVTVIPVLVEGAQLPTAEELPDDLVALREYQICRLRNKEWKSDVARIRKTIDTQHPPRGLSWLTSKVRIAVVEHTAVVSAVFAAIVVAAALLFALGQEEDDPSPIVDRCHNEKISPEVRAELSKAAGESAPAVYGSVYYGKCDSRAYAIAAFPDKTNDVFVQDDFHWQMLGPVPTVKCKQVPGELLDEWTVNDC